MKIVDENKFEEKEKSFFERMKIQMMQNLQLNLKNLHISYETMSTTKLGHPFSFGLTITSLKLHGKSLQIQFFSSNSSSLVINEFRTNRKKQRKFLNHLQSLNEILY